MGKSVITRTICECDWCSKTKEVSYDGTPKGWVQDIHFEGPGDIFCTMGCHGLAKEFWELAAEEGIKFTTEWYFKQRKEMKAKAQVKKKTARDKLLTEELEKEQEAQAAE